MAANPGMSLSSAANRLVDEALRMNEHPGIVFGPGPTGRRAGLVGVLTYGKWSARSNPPGPQSPAWLG